MLRTRRIWSNPIEALRTAGLVATLTLAAWCELQLLAWLAGQVSG